MGEPCGRFPLVPVPARPLGPRGAAHFGPGEQPPRRIPGGRSPISVEELVRRLQRVEQQNAKLAEQNQALVRQLDTMTSRYDQLNQRYDQLNRRLEQIEPRPGLPTPALPAARAAHLGISHRASRTLPNGSRLRSRTRDREPLQAGCGATPDPSPPGREPARPGLAVPGRRLRRRSRRVRPGPAPGRSARPVRAPVGPVHPGAVYQLRAEPNTWIDSTGTPRPVRSFESVEITRNFVQFSGFGLDPRLQFTAILFSSTALNDTVYLGWINYRFSDAFDLRVGNWVVPGTREWYESFRYTLGADRLMATTFFRPNISPGMSAQGEPITNVRYVAMLANSLNRFSQGVERVGSAADLRGDRLVGADGRLRPRAVGHRESSIAQPADRHQPGPFARAEPRLREHWLEATPRTRILRLSNGTPLFRPGARGRASSSSRPACNSGRSMPRSSTGAWASRANTSCDGSMTSSRAGRAADPLPLRSRGTLAGGLFRAEGKSAPFREHADYRQRKGFGAYPTRR